MRRSLLLVSTMALALIVASGVALALPSETPDQTPMVDGTVRAIEHVGTNIWVGGKLAKIIVATAPFWPTSRTWPSSALQTNQYKNIAPKLGGTDSEVWDMSISGQNVLIAGKLSGPTTPRRTCSWLTATPGR